MIVAYCAGAITMLWFVTPGKIDFKNILNQEKLQESVNFDYAAKKVEKLPEKVTNMAGFYAVHAQKYVKENFQRDK